MTQLCASCLTVWWSMSFREILFCV